MLWGSERVSLGAEYNAPHDVALTPMKPREWAVAVPLFVLAILFGVFPAIVLRYMDETIDMQTTELAQWTREFDIAESKKTAEQQKQKAQQQDEQKVTTNDHTPLPAENNKQPDDRPPVNQPPDEPLVSQR